TDSAVGKRTTAWVIVDAIKNAGYSAELIGTGQTAWMQGARYGIILDSLINDFVSGELEHAIWSAWNEQHPDAIVIEGQGSLLNPAYPGGFEILAAGRPDVIVLQHAPARKEYDGFPGYPIHPLAQQIQAIEIISGKPIVAITINHENLELESIPAICHQLQIETGIPAFDVLLDGADTIVDILRPYLLRHENHKSRSLAH
ncbi:MAG: NAD-dependent epimerase/dehydratase family protein, partial [candidate division KSB1 bacterium]|nr:NAD-dependent epimerase/dehydratase family protein [candidate division KSB1 bacterium]